MLDFTVTQDIEQISATAMDGTDGKGLFVFDHDRNLILHRIVVLPQGVVLNGSFTAELVTFDDTGAVIEDETTLMLTIGYTDGAGALVFDLYDPLQFVLSPQRGVRVTTTGGARVTVGVAYEPFCRPVMDGLTL